MRSSLKIWWSVVPWTSAATVTASRCCNYGPCSVRSCFVSAYLAMGGTSEGSCFCLPFNCCLCLFESGVLYIHRCLQCFVGSSSCESSVGSRFVPAYPAVGGLCPRTMLALGTSVRMVMYLLACDQDLVCMVVFLLTMQSSFCPFAVSCF